MNATAPKIAREVVARLARSWGIAEIEDAVKIAVSELVTNAFVHAAGMPGSTVLVEVRRVEACFHVQVRDGSSAAPVDRGRGHDDENGRGLLLVRELTDACGWTPTPFGKTVWFELKAAWPLDVAA
ncbi:ATP-binding protein [Thermomonospora echinospora]|uniref:ATP-binding protein n=1 Tax=Thermomonospora echinospora TaxID=1992 RepID=UPI001358204F|nr:ATP-binding protein [Thermomonospora echinospora]